MKKTKIIATLGPASSSKEVLREMVAEGMNVARINFSHGSYEYHAQVIQYIREINEETGLNIAILADLQGPKIRTLDMENNKVELIPGEKVEIVTEEILGTSKRFAINYDQLAVDVNEGEYILLDDGKLQLKVLSTDGKVIQAEVVYGGFLSSHKGVNLPNTAISLPSLTEKDKEDLQFAMDQNVDWIGLSFVRSARDIIELKHIISKHHNKAKIVAKIEKPEALKDIDNIIQNTDAIMVARGDLGVEIPMEDVPLVQKMLIKKSYSYAKPVIVATQMMESMITDFSPTRAEVNDVANAVLDGVDAVMLSGETSVGKHPPLVIKAMSKIVSKIEESDSIYYREEVPVKNQERFISDSICFNATRLGSQVNAKAIVTMSFSGYTAYKIASQRPKSEIFVFTMNKEILTQLNLVWGVRAIYYDKMVSTDHTIADIKFILKELGYIKEGDLIINLASMPIEAKGKSNMIRLSYVE
ncbi:MAG: pyruvate kinase [Brumimicrobium sp.]|nr:pyruvate kinase [Brumimicrobium sp.]MCO5269589.1 pyruvate kinase [Brumimicrobium sp.]